jgi:asparagine synthase (glutamine-hydrolysing)
MCGIAGLIDLSRTEAENIGILQSMLEVQHHRGPDSTDIWTDKHIFLGHNRLSIIDLSEASNQPMHYKNFSIVFNGEIYNYLELKKELTAKGHIFQTSGDTEIILHAFEEWGEQCVSHFLGMWSFFIWNNKLKQFFASRDRFGIKPFYYLQNGSAFVFASEIKTLKKSPHFNDEINLLQVSRGLQLGWLGYNDETYYRHVKSLPAATNLLFDGVSYVAHRYWKPQTGKYSNLTFEEKKNRFYSLFSDSIKLHMRSDVPVASCLSGGIDSSAIVSMVQQQLPGKAYKSFSIYYEGEGDIDERPFIKEVIKKYPAIEPHYFSPDDNEVAEHFDRALYHADIPVSGSSFISQYFLMKLISENNIKVVLDGQGADEYLAGYMHSFYRLIAGMLQQFKIYKAINTTVRINRRINNSLQGSVMHFSKSFLSLLRDEQELYELEYRHYFPFVSEQKHDIPFKLEDIDGTKMDAFLYHLLFTTSLPSLLHYEDRNSMAFSVESRVPFLDHRLVEFCFSLFDDDKIKGVETKYILRESLKNILPLAIYSRKDKKGFVTPGENKWLRGPLKHLIESPKSLPDFINHQKVERIFKNYKSGDSTNATLVWRLGVLGEWVRKG